MPPEHWAKLHFNRITAFDEVLFCSPHITHSACAFIDIVKERVESAHLWSTAVAIVQRMHLKYSINLLKLKKN
jgi:hypothetical protein